MRGAGTGRGGAQQRPGRAPSRRCAPAGSRAATTRGCSSPACPTSRSVDVQRRAPARVPRGVLVGAHGQSTRAWSATARPPRRVGPAAGRPAPHQPRRLAVAGQDRGDPPRLGGQRGVERGDLLVVRAGARRSAAAVRGRRRAGPEDRGRSRRARRPGCRGRRCAAASRAGRAAAWCAAAAPRRRAGWPAAPRCGAVVVRSRPSASRRPRRRTGRTAPPPARRRPAPGRCGAQPLGVGEARARPGRPAAAPGSSRSRPAG